MTASINTVINSKPCIYNCDTRIYWNASENAYFEVFSQKRHICPHRSNNSKSATQTTTKPNYYSKKVGVTKPKMSNSLEFLTGPCNSIQRKYEILSDVVSEYNGKVHGSQRDRDPKTGFIDLLVYYEVPEGKRDEVKRKSSMLISLIISQTR